jgi:hypothetical protein
MSLKTMTVAELRREIARREAGAAKLATRRARLAKIVAAMDAELARLGVDAPKRRGRPPGRKRGRRGPGRPMGSKNKRRAKPAKNSLSLAEAVSKVVAVGKTVSPAEVMARVRKVYKSSSKSFGVMVAGTLAKHPEFKRLGRGKYVRKGGGKAEAAPKARKPK